MEVAALVLALGTASMDLARLNVAAQNHWVSQSSYSWTLQPQIFVSFAAQFVAIFLKKACINAGRSPQSMGWVSHLHLCQKLSESIEQVSAHAANIQTFTLCSTACTVAKLILLI